MQPHIPLLVALCVAVVAGENATSVGTFLPPAIEHFFHADLLVGYPTNTTTLFGLSGRTPNGGGNVTGAIVGEIVPVGAASEIFPPSNDGSRSFYVNQWTINTTDSTILVNTQAVTQYANNAVYGLGSVSIEAGPGKYENLSYERFVGQVSGDFGTGEAVLDVFKLVVQGRVDGLPINALLTPGPDGQE